MEELENTNPIMDNPGENPVTPEPEVNASTSPAEPEQSQDFSQLFSENIAENTPAQQSEPIQETQPVSSPVVPQPQENQVETITPEPQVEVETPSFEKVMEDTTLDNSQSIQAAQAAEQKKAALEQQKLAWLKQHEDKARKSGFAKWFLLGIVLLLLGFVACSLFAKEQVINAMDYLQSLIPTNSLTSLNKDNNQVIENTEISENDLLDTEESEAIDEEEIDEIQEYYNKIDEIISWEDDQETKVEQLRNLLTQVIQENEEPDEKLTQYISQNIMNLTINSEETQNEENNTSESEESSEEETNNSESNEVVELENNEEEINNEVLNNPESNETSEETIEEESEEKYTIIHVNSEDEANWVLPAHCSDLTCYGEDEEFIACTSFRMIETLDETTPRVSSRWGCKYKDASELVYVEFK